MLLMSSGCEMHLGYTIDNFTQILSILAQKLSRTLEILQSDWTAVFLRPGTTLSTGLQSGLRFSRGWAMRN